VRAAAVQEASEILLSTRQEIRRVLVQTRRELVQLAAQLRPDGLVRTRRFARDATEQPERAATTAENAAAAEREILERHQRWFDSFERGDRATMASLVADNFSLVDQRPKRTPAASGRVELTIQDLRVQVTAGIGAVLSARIAETTTADDAPATTVAMLSEVWIRRGDEWQLVSVRMVPLDTIPATLQ
jgi:hypothetical protein